MPKEILLNRRQFGKLAVREGIKLAYPEIESDLYRDYWRGLVRGRGIVGGRENYQIPLEGGNGFATWHRKTMAVCLTQFGDIQKQLEQNETGPESLSPPDRNIYNIAEGGAHSIVARINHDQSNLTPLQALDSGLYAGLMATRSRNGIGLKYVAYAVPSPQSKPQFLGIAMAVDCPKEREWQRKFSHWTYSFLGWEKLPWIAEVSDGLLARLPVGLSGDPKQYNEGRPGILLVAEDVYRQLNSFGTVIDSQNFCSRRTRMR